MEIRDIYLYVGMYVCSFFYGMFTRASTNYFDSVRQTAHFTWAGLALTNTADSSIAHTP